eukprot:4737149-Pyramimonas_sp.AAC.1
MTGYAAFLARCQLGSREFWGAWAMQTGSLQNSPLSFDGSPATQSRVPSNSQAPVPKVIGNIASLVGRNILRSTLPPTIVDIGAGFAIYKGCPGR